MTAIRIAILGMIFGLCPALASANAWQREAGSGFASIGTQLSWPVPVEQASEPKMMTSAFVEYGLTKKLSLGIDFSQEDGGDQKIILFAQTPLVATESGHRIALEMGVGQISEETVVRPGLSYGFGFAREKGGGWVSVDANAAVGLSDQSTALALDLTYGLSAVNGLKYIFQVQSGKSEGSEAFSRFAPSVVVPWGETRNVELGMTYGLSGEDEVGVKLGLWQKF